MKNCIKLFWNAHIIYAWAMLSKQFLKGNILVFHRKLCWYVVFLVINASLVWMGIWNYVWETPIKFTPDAVKVPQLCYITTLISTRNLLHKGHTSQLPSPAWRLTRVLTGLKMNISLIKRWFFSVTPFFHSKIV